jgi:hypothetical protein
MSAPPDTAPQTVEPEHWVFALPVHPAAECFPMVPATVVKLMQSIKENGQREPISVDEEQKHLIAGRHRREACRLLGIAPRVRIVEISGDDYEAIATYARDENLVRFHLDVDEQVRSENKLATLRERVIAAAKANPTTSINQIAKDTGTTQPTASKIINEAVATGDVQRPLNVVDTKGRTQPARKPAKPPAPASSPPPGPSKSPSRRRDEAIVALIPLLRAKPAETAEDIMRLLGDEPGIGALSLARRVELCHGLFKALNVSFFDMRPACLAPQPEPTPEPAPPIAAAEPAPEPELPLPMPEPKPKPDIIEWVVLDPEPVRSLTERVAAVLAASKQALVASHLADLVFGSNTGINRFSVTRAALRMMRHAAAARIKAREALAECMREAEAILGRAPKKKGWDVLLGVGDGVTYYTVDKEFAATLETTASWRARSETFQALTGARALVPDILTWRTTKTDDGRLWFHPATYPVRVWAVDIQPAGVIWVEAEITKITENNVMVRYAGEIARLDRIRLARVGGWANWRGVMFATGRAGETARRFDEMWQDQFGRAYSRAGTVPPVMRMPIADAMALLGLSGNYTERDINSAFRLEAMKTHPDVGGTAEQFRALVEARDRLLAALGTNAPQPVPPTFTPSGFVTRYHVVKSSRPRLGPATPTLGSA